MADVERDRPAREPRVDGGSGARRGRGRGGGHAGRGRGRGRGHDMLIADPADPPPAAVADADGVAKPFSCAHRPFEDSNHIVV
jgi:hypothetical protein